MDKKIEPTNPEQIEADSAERREGAERRTQGLRFIKRKLARRLGAFRAKG